MTSREILKFLVLISHAKTVITKVEFIKWVEVILLKTGRTKAVNPSRGGGGNSFCHDISKQTHLFSPTTVFL